MRFAPSRGRELKYRAYLRDVDIHRFAPSRGRELKYGTCYHYSRHNSVRPLAGAGIEMLALDLLIFPLAVRPLAGAGIEIVPPHCLMSLSTRSPPRGGGN